ncbi:hypothetical protein [Halopseudomonas bauzanensis]|uniref:hypothetical protein n=1 Tax=Halopseudomonas bauzanensis TaxID=653930 RepID=UPI002554C661|nr:hypothetical protein [Halopseudomonas bauzanensis]
MLKKIIALLFLSSPFVTAHAESNANKSICSEEMKWIIGKPLRIQEYAILNASGKIFDKFVEINSQKNVTSEGQLWAYKILATGNHMLKEQPIESPRIKNLTNGFSDSASQIIRGEIDFEEFKLQINSLIQKAEIIDQDLYAEKSTLIEEDRKQVDAVYKCVLASAMYGSLTNAKLN